MFVYPPDFELFFQRRLSTLAAVSLPLLPTTPPASTLKLTHLTTSMTVA